MGTKILLVVRHTLFFEWSCGCHAHACRGHAALNQGLKHAHVNVGMAPGCPKIKL